MQCVSWLLAVLVLCVCGSAVDAQCWDLADCNNLDSQDKIIECIQQCRMKQLVTNTESVLPNQQQRSKEEEEDGLSLITQLSALALSDASGEQLPSSKVHTTISTDDEKGHKEPSMATPSLSLKRHQLESGKERGKRCKQKKNKKNTNTKSATNYRMTHFRWSAPPNAKLNSGFIKPCSKQSHKPLPVLPQHPR